MVQTDEMLYVKLAGTWVRPARRCPTLHGEHVGFLGVVYPIALAPFYGRLDNGRRIRRGPRRQCRAVRERGDPRLPARAGGWCRRLGAGRRAARGRGAMGVNAAFVMSEAAAYPVFLWAVLACHAAITEPSPRRTRSRSVALALAFFTRPQFLFLAAVLPLAALIAVGPGRRFGGTACWPSSMRSAPSS